MSEAQHLRARWSSPPSIYLNFIDDAKRFAESKEVDWSMPLAETGKALPGHGWDLRRLNGSHERNATWLRGFAIDQATRAAALENGWNAAALPSGAIVQEAAQEFIKAMVAHRCSTQNTEKAIRCLAAMCLRLFSVLSKPPWEISSEDVARFLMLENSNVAKRQAGLLARVMNENLLSTHCPVLVDGAAERTNKIRQDLNERDDDEKLPEMRPLYELARIVFQEAPQGHQELIRFMILRAMILTGLRVTEVVMLPLDCLVWEKHVDVVTGMPAGEVGGVSMSLGLRYFGEKREGGAPDVLVEDVQWVPQRFHSALVEAIETAKDATQELRQLLADQHSDREAHPGSDLRRFKTADGRQLTTADMLFITLFRHRGKLPETIPSNAKIAVSHVVTLREDLGVSGRARNTLFTRYAPSAEAKEFKVNPHSLRHLMNTEFFRLGVPDTLITQQFGRKTVAQSYVYDHRSLAEHLRFVQLPQAAKSGMKPGSPQELVAKMVVSGLAEESHIAKSFKSIQSAHGDEVAFTYLASNSDGFHVTPYGFCTNSFSLNPCARHLKCFDQCKHYAASGLPVHRITLEKLKISLTSMRSAALSKPAISVGRRNQIAHADRLIAGVSAALDAQPKTAVFPDGRDHSELEKDLFS
ncbi:site-specific tyrosine recombinase XerD [compost metagenome]